jgi:hypothetical protein
MRDLSATDQAIAARVCVAFSGSEKHLTLMSKILEKLEGKSEYIEQAEAEDRRALMILSIYPVEVYKLTQLASLASLFRNILKNYLLAPTERRLIEKASKYFTRSSIRRVRWEKAIEQFKKVKAEYQAFYDAAKRAIARGKPLEEEAVGHLQVGPMRLMNTGGFDPRSMKTVEKALKTAIAALKKKGLGKVCYGEVNLVRTIQRSSSVLAFYTSNSDELFVRGNVKNVSRLAGDIVHELGHRLEHRFVNRSDVKSLYRTIKRGEDVSVHDILRDPSRRPSAGDVLTVDGTRYEFIKPVYMRSGTFAGVTDLSNGKAYRIPIASWLDAAGKLGEGSGFVSEYAKTSAGENFAEMVRVYCTTGLPSAQEELLLKII